MKLHLKNSFVDNALLLWGGLRFKPPEKAKTEGLNPAKAARVIQRQNSRLAQQRIDRVTEKLCGALRKKAWYGRLVWFLKPMVRRAVKTGLAAYKFDLLVAGKEKERPEFFSEKERWFIEGKVERVLGNLLSKNGKSYSTSERASRWTRKVAKYHGQRNYLIVSYALYVLSASAPSLEKVVGRAKQIFRKKILRLSQNLENNSALMQIGRVLLSTPDLGACVQLVCEHLRQYATSSAHGLRSKKSLPAKYGKELTMRRSFIQNAMILWRLHAGKLSVDQVTGMLHGFVEDNAWYGRLSWFLRGRIRSQVEKGLAAYKFDLVVRGDQERFSKICSQKEKTFMENGTLRILGHLLAKRQTEGSPSEKASRWREKVNKYHNKPNYLATSYAIDFLGAAFGFSQKKVNLLKFILRTSMLKFSKEVDMDSEAGKMAKTILGEMSIAGL